MVIGGMCMHMCCVGKLIVCVAVHIDIHVCMCVHVAVAHLAPIHFACLYSGLEHGAHT